MNSKEGIFIPVPCTPPFLILYFLQLFREVDVYMARFLHHDFSSPHRRSYMHVLAVLWTAGLLSGIWAWAITGPSVLPLMRSTLLGPVSIVSLLFSTGLPFLFSAFAVFFSCQWLVFPIAFCKGICYSYVSMGILSSFSNAGWGLWILIQISDAVTLPLLYRFWQTCLLPADGYFPHRCMVTASILLLAGSVDYSLIQPFLAELLIL